MTAVTHTLDVAVVHRRLAHYRLPLYDGLVRQNPDLRLTVYCGDTGEGRGTSGMALGAALPAYVHPVANRRMFLRGTEFIVQPSVIARLMRRPPDVVVFEGRVLLLSNLPVMLWRRLTGRPNIIWLKGWPDAVGEGRLSRLARTLYLSLGNAFIVYGRSSIERLQAYGVPSDRVHVAQNTVDVGRLLQDVVDRAAPADSADVQRVLDGGPFLLTVGRLVKDKAVTDLVDAFAALARDDVSLTLVVAGRGPELEPVRARAAASNVADRVVFTGAISDADAERLFRAASCCIFPGAVGLALNQALAAGRPVICADEWGPDAELLVHEETGLRYPPGDIAALAAAIRRLLDDKALAAALAGRGREKIRTSASMDNMIARYSAALRRAARHDNS